MEKTSLALILTLVLIQQAFSQSMEGSSSFLSQDPMLTRFESWKLKFDKKYGSSEHEQRF